MKYQKSDLVVIAGTILVVTTFSLLLYIDFTRRVSSGSGEKVGEITFKRGVAQRQYYKQVIWEDLKQRDDLYNNDSIRTFDLSDAVIRLKDGTIIELAENSLILLSLKKDSIDIDFSFGSLSTQRDSLKHGDVKELRIKSKDTVVKVEKSDIMLSKNDNDLNLTVQKGNVKIKTADEEKVIKEDQKAVVSKDAKKARVYRVNLKLNEPPANSYFITNASAREISFSWQKPRNNKRVFFEVSRSPFFKDIVLSENASRNTITKEFTAGTYYWRLRSGEADSKESETSESRKFILIRDRPVKIITPANGQVYNYRVNPPLINFKWEKNIIASEYTIELSTEKNMKKIIKSRGSVDTGISIDNLSSGVYYWRVRTKTSLPGVAHSSISSVFRFDVSEKKELEPPGLVSPESNFKISSLILNRKYMIFNWEKNPEVLKTDLYIARDRDFKDLVLQESVKGNFYTFKKGLPEGRYFWRVRGACTEDVLTPFSESRGFAVVKSSEIKLLLPGNRAVVAPLEDSSPVLFTWSRIDIGGKFKIRISRTENFKTVYKEAAVDSCSYQLKDVSPGTYFWKVELLDENGHELMSSRSNAVIIRDRMPLPDIIGPANGSVVNMQDRSTLDFNWKDLQNANLYEIKLFQISDNKSPVVAMKVKGTGYKVDNLKLLDRGKFYWTLQAFERDSSGKIIRKSEPVKNFFRIDLGKPLDKPKIISPEVHFLK